MQGPSPTLLLNLVQMDGLGAVAANGPCMFGALEGHTALHCFVCAPAYDGGRDGGEAAQELCH